jgi:arsenite methyltransferase
MPMTLSKSNYRSIEKYKKKASFYDGTSHRTDWIRATTIEQLQLKPGDTVLDVGCGTGLSFELLRQKVGESGKVIGFDQSPDMLEIANKRIASHGWNNVQTVLGFSETIRFDSRVSAYLFHYTHDILQSPAAVKNLLSAAAPNAHISIAGMKYFPWWTGPLNIYAFFKNYAWNGNGTGLMKPWRHLEQHAPLTSWRATQLGMGYIATAQYKRI